jgi:hypothetical protein
MKILRGTFKFIVGFGCTAFFSYWLLSKFMTVGDGTGIAIFIFALLVGIVSAVEKDEEDGKEG